jgi:Adenylate cyclase, class 2 (thermophilic)
MQNIELKAELRDLPLARTIARGIGATYILTFDQTDTYYRIPRGKLKKRETQDEPVEFIFYDRPTRAGAKPSNFTIYSQEQAIERFGTTPLPVWLVVRKRRELYMLGNVRIHLDTVEGLGTFIEFEALVTRDYDAARCAEAVANLQEKFRPAMGELIDCGYADLLARELDSAPTREPDTAG